MQDFFVKIIVREFNILGYTLNTVITLINPDEAFCT